MNEYQSDEQGDSESGVTLIEVMLVVFIISILVTLALTALRGPRERAQDRSAQTTLRSVYLSAQTLYSNRGEFSLVNFEATSLSERGFEIVPGNELSSGSHFASIEMGEGTQGWAAAVQSKSGKCFHIRVVANDLDAAVVGDYYGVTSDSTPCNGESATDAFVTWDPDS